MTVVTARTLETNCGRQGISGFTNSTRLSCDLYQGNLTVTRGFATGSTTDPVTLVFTMPAMRNPRSLKPSSSFVIAFYDGDEDYPTYIKTNSTQITMSSASTIKAV